MLAENAMLSMATEARKLGINNLKAEFGYHSKWRTHKGYKPGDLSPQIEKALLDLMNKFEKESKPADPNVRVSMSELAQVTLKKRIPLRKGRWRRFSAEMEERIIASEREKQ